jgi:uncharacterized protein
MKNLLLLIALAVFSFGNHRLEAQSAPSFITSDPQVDTKFPAAMAGITVPSHGVDMDAVFYLASGPGPHGTVLLLHGLPGYEMNADMAQSIRRAGWNVLIFHYRGDWGTAGDFSQQSSIEDTAEAVRFLCDPANLQKFRMDPRNLVVIGHSLGGFLAGYEAVHDPRIAAVGMIAAVNLGTINSDAGEREKRIQRWQAQMHPLHGATAAQLFAEAQQHAKDWDYVQWADALRDRPLLLVQADDQNRTSMQALADVLRHKGTLALTSVAVVTDHSFSDHRIALQTIVIEWLEKLKK